MDEVQARGKYLKEMSESPGGQILLKQIDSMIIDGWAKFIALPVAQKTSKAAFNYQARYEVLKDLKDWVESEKKMAP